MRTDTVTVTVNGTPVTAPRDTTLCDVLHGETPCGGHGVCGKCKVRATGALSAPCGTERRLLSDNELAEGVRLACRTQVQGDCAVTTLAAPTQPQIVTDGVAAHRAPTPPFAGCGAAVDIGTTTVVARLYGGDGRLLAEAAELNPQTVWGADVITRIEASLNGESRALAAAIQEAVNDLLITLSKQADVDTDTVDSVVITGNAVMLSLFTQEDVSPFARAPFALTHRFGETRSAAALALSCLRPTVPVYLPPCISAFIGADITCALLATALCEHRAALLLDIGTNGELALWHDGTLTVCSTAAGPAFEGADISMGMRGAAGAIDRVEVTDGVLSAHVIGEGAPCGICGSGLVDAVACMLKTAVIDEDGFLSAPFTVCPPVTLTSHDLRMVQLAKSAVCAGVLTLLQEEHLTAQALECVYVAGGFGHYLDLTNAEAIGLLPRGIPAAARTVGNAALSGAALLLLDPAARATAKRIAETAVTVDLSAHPTFSEHYIRGMSFEPIE